MNVIYKIMYKYYDWKLNWIGKKYGVSHNKFDKYLGIRDCFF